jgi:glycosidase
MAPPHSTLYQINTRVWLNELGQQLGHPATLDHVKDETLDQLAEQGFDWIWLLGVWQTGPAGRAVSLSREDWRDSFLQALPDLREEDIVSSPFAVRAYTVHTDFGGDDALIGFPNRLRQRGLRLMLDYVPNHTALDHAWVWEHPEYYISGSDDDLKREPQNYYRAGTRSGWQILAHGRDPYFSGWPDSLQLNYRHAGLRQAMTSELLKITDRCDGVRCDMAMLLLPNVIQKKVSTAKPEEYKNR